MAYYDRIDNPEVYRNDSAIIYTLSNIPTKKYTQQHI